MLPAGIANGGRADGGAAGRTGGHVGGGSGPHLHAR
jgi:hypothetical protein